MTSCFTHVLNCIYKVILKSNWKFIELSTIVKMRYNWAIWQKKGVS